MILYIEAFSVCTYNLKLNCLKKSDLVGIPSLSNVLFLFILENVFTVSFDNNPNQVYSVFRSKACTPNSMKKEGTVHTDHTNSDDQVFLSNTWGLNVNFKSDVMC